MDKATQLINAAGFPGCRVRPSYLAALLRLSRGLHRAGILVRGRIPR